MKYRLTVIETTSRCLVPRQQQRRSGCCDWPLPISVRLRSIVVLCVIFTFISCSSRLQTFYQYQTDTEQNYLYLYPDKGTYLQVIHINDVYNDTILGKYNMVLNKLMLVPSAGEMEYLPICHNNGQTSIQIVDGVNGAPLIGVTYKLLKSKVEGHTDSTGIVFIPNSKLPDKIMLFYPGYFTFDRGLILPESSIQLRMGRLTIDHERKQVYRIEKNRILHKGYRLVLYCQPAKQTNSYK